MQSRSISWVAVLLIFLWLLLVCLVARGETETLPPPPPSLRGAPAPPLSAVPVPEPAHLDQFVADRAAAIRLGKALFWAGALWADRSAATAFSPAGAATSRPAPIPAAPTSSTPT